MNHSIKNIHVFYNIGDIKPIQANAHSETAYSAQQINIQGPHTSDYILYRSAASKNWDVNSSTRWDDRCSLMPKLHFHMDKSRKHNPQYTKLSDDFILNLRKHLSQKDYVFIVLTNEFIDNDFHAIKSEIEAVYLKKLYFIYSEYEAFKNSVVHDIHIFSKYILLKKNNIKKTRKNRFLQK